MMLNALVSVFVGTLLGVGFALLRELLDRRVRSLDDLTTDLDIPVLGVLPRPLRGQLAGRNAAMVLPSNILSRLPRPGV
jgi:hypothetical protein